MELGLAYEILDTLKVMQEAVEYMRVTCEEDNLSECLLIRQDIMEGLFHLQGVGKKHVQEDSGIKLHDACTCALVSIGRINRKMLEENRNRAIQKITFELIPTIHTMTHQFYYWGIAYEHPEKLQEFKEYISKVAFNPHIAEAERTGEYKYDLTILVTGFNHLDYTVQCVNSILKQIPKELRCELLLVNHGSTDGTKIFFDRIAGAKTLDIAINCALPGIPYSAIEGQYLLSVSNDIILGDNVIENLYRCISEHEDYGWVVPTTPNVSNLQTIPMRYATNVEFERKSRENNIYDERRHEERVRLCNPVDIIRTVEQLKIMQDTYIEGFCVKELYCFPDDRVSMFMRRKGLKLILAKDAYCHHFGSVTIGKVTGVDEAKAKMYLEGRKAFYYNYGIDPWGIGFCYDTALLEILDYKVEGQVNILGINCGLGSNPLKVQEIYRENGKEKKDIYVCNIIQEERLLQDVSGVSDEVHVLSEPNSIIERCSKKHYDYVIVEDKILGAESLEGFVQELLNKCDCSVLCYRWGRENNTMPQPNSKYVITNNENWVVFWRIE